MSAQSGLHRCRRAAVPRSRCRRSQTRLRREPSWLASVYPVDDEIFLLWCILLILCWPLALLALVVYPLVWVALIPFRIMGLAVDGLLQLVRGIVMLPGATTERPAHAV